MDVTEQFWSLVAPLLEREGVARGTMMGTACVRAGGGFVAMPHRGQLIVKLTEPRVQALIAQEVGAAFAPNGRVFRAWVAVGPDQQGEWRALVEEGIALAAAP